MPRSNRATIAPIPPRRRLSENLALPDPAEPRLGGLIGRPVLAVAPVSSGAFLVVLPPARQADHASIVPGGEPQAAFARRIRRRRSAERSSSLSPPQVPYFSGRLTA